MDELQKPSQPEDLPDAPAEAVGRGKKINEGKGMRPQVSWPMALRAVRGWLEPWIMLRRYWERLVVTAPASCHATPASLA